MEITFDPRIQEERDFVASMLRQMTNAQAISGAVGIGVPTPAPTSSKAPEPTKPPAKKDAAQAATATTEPESAPNPEPATEPKNEPYEPVELGTVQQFIREYLGAVEPEKRPGQLMAVRTFLKKHFGVELTTDIPASELPKAYALLKGFVNGGN